jgi:hypothetical protein
MVAGEQLEFEFMEEVYRAKNIRETVKGVAIGLPLAILAGPVGGSVACYVIGDLLGDPISVSDLLRFYKEVFLPFL